MWEVQQAMHKYTHIHREKGRENNQCNILWKTIYASEKAAILSASICYLMANFKILWVFCNKQQKQHILNGFYCYWTLDRI